MNPFTKDRMRELIKAYNLATPEDVHSMLKDMFGGVLQEMLEAELDTELGYPKHGEYGSFRTDRTTRPRRCF